MRKYKVKIAKLLATTIIIALVFGNGAIALALQEFKVEPINVAFAGSIPDDVYFGNIIKWNDTYFATQDWDIPSWGRPSVLFAADDESLVSWTAVYNAGGVSTADPLNFGKSYIQTVVHEDGASMIHYSSNGKNWYSAPFPEDYTFLSQLSGDGEYFLFTAQRGNVQGVLATTDFKDWKFIEDFPTVEKGHTLKPWDLQYHNDTWYIYSQFENNDRKTADDAYGVTHFYRASALPNSPEAWEKVGQYDNIAVLWGWQDGDIPVILDPNYASVSVLNESTGEYEQSIDDAFTDFAYINAPDYNPLYSAADWNSWALARRDSLVEKNYYYSPRSDNTLEADNVTEGDRWGENKGKISTDGGETWFAPRLSIAGKIDNPSQWAQASVDEAAALGLVTIELNANYQSNTTRIQFCRAAVNFLRQYGYDTAGVTPKRFSDTNDNDVGIAAALGITAGTDAKLNLFSPDGTLTREQAATLLNNTLKVIGKDITATAPAWTDIGSISGWAGDAVSAIYSAGIMSGTDTEKLVFSPKEPYTHEQSIVTLLRLWKYVKD
jgi:hypothetical protein